MKFVVYRAVFHNLNGNVKKSEPQRSFPANKIPFFEFLFYCQYAQNSGCGADFTGRERFRLVHLLLALGFICPVLCKINFGA